MIINLTLNLKHIILITIGLLILKYIYDNYKKKIIEKAGNTPKIDQTMLDAINKVYKADIEAIRNLSSYATYLMSGDAKGSGVTVPASLTATTSLTSPIVNTDILTSTISLNTSTINIGKTSITENILFDLLNTQTAIIGGGSQKHDIVFAIPFKNIPTVLINVIHEDKAGNGVGRWRLQDLLITNTGFSFILVAWAGDGIGYFKFIWTAMYCSKNYLIK
jgi:hypothetical protein